MSSSRSEIVFLAVAAALITLIRWHWMPALGVLMGLLFTAGFLLSPSGVDNLLGSAGVVAAIGQLLHFCGAGTACVAGLLAITGRRRAGRAS